MIAESHPLLRTFDCPVATSPHRFARILKQEQKGLKLLEENAKLTDQAIRVSYVFMKDPKYLLNVRRNAVNMAANQEQRLGKSCLFFLLGMVLLLLELPMQGPWYPT